MSDCWSEEEYWSDYNAVNLSDANESDFSDEDCDVKQSINLNDHLAFNHLYMFVSAQLEVKSDLKNAYWDAEFFDYVFQL